MGQETESFPYLRREGQDRPLKRICFLLRCSPDQNLLYLPPYTTPIPPMRCRVSHQPSSCVGWRCSRLSPLNISSCLSCFTHGRRRIWLSPCIECTSLYVRPRNETNLLTTTVGQSSQLEDASGPPPAVLALCPPPLADSHTGSLVAGLLPEPVLTQPSSYHLAAWRLLPGASHWVLSSIQFRYTLQFHPNPHCFDGVHPTVTNSALEASVLQQ